MKTALLAAAVATLLAGSAGATTTISYIGYGTDLPPGEVLITNFDDSSVLPSGYGLSGSGSFLTGTSGVGAAPAISPVGRDPSQYLSLEAGQSETLSTPLLRGISLYVGSLDSYNQITFTFQGGATQTLGGADLAAAVTGAAIGGDQQSAASNGRYIFGFSAPITDVTFYSSGNSFEISDIAAMKPRDMIPGGGFSASPAPEPAPWAMMLLGFAGLGGLLRQRRRGGAPVQA